MVLKMILSPHIGDERVHPEALLRTSSGFLAMCPILCHHDTLPRWHRHQVQEHHLSGRLLMPVRVVVPNVAGPLGEPIK